MTRPLSLRASALFALLAASGCSAAAPSSSATSDQHLEQTTPVVKGAVWLKCWFTTAGADFFQTYTLSCSGPSDPRYPVQLAVLAVEAHGSGGADVSGFVVGGGAGDPAVARDIGALYADRFPVKVIVQAALPQTPGGAMGSQLGASLLRFETTIDKPDTVTPDKPLVVRQPFDLWPITIIGKTSRYLFVHDRFSTSLGALIDSSGASATDVDGNVVQAEDFASKTFYVVAPPDGHLSARYVTATADAKVTLDAPGTYVATDATLLRGVAGESPAPTPDPTPTPDPGAGSSGGPTPGPTTTPPASPPDPTPAATCGVPGLVCCGGDKGTCDPTSFCKFNPNGPNTCVACGGANQDCCGGDQGTCGDGTYCKPNPNGPNQCTACGGPGQECCGGDKGTCGGGTYCKSNPNGPNHCTSCGGANQDCCGGDSGTCGAGLSCTYNPSGTNQCK